MSIAIFIFVLVFWDRFESLTALKYTFSATWRNNVQKNIEQKYTISNTVSNRGNRLTRLFSIPSSASIPQSSKYCVQAALHVKPERRKEFLEEILQTETGTLSEEVGCLQYSWGESTVYPNVFHFAEQFVDEDAFKAHVTSLHCSGLQTFTASNPAPFTKSPELFFYNSMGNGSPHFFIKLRKLFSFFYLQRIKQKYCLQESFHVKPERREEFIEAILQNQACTLAVEVNCLQYVLGESTVRPNVFRTSKQFVNEDAFKAHTASSHFSLWETFINSDPSPFTRPPETLTFTSMGKDVFTFKSKLRKLGAYLKRILHPKKILSDTATAIDTAFYNWFLFFEQFDPNPVTIEGKRRRALQQAAIERGEVHTEEQGLPSFVAW